GARRRRDADLTAGFDGAGSARKRQPSSTRLAVSADEFGLAYHVTLHRGFQTALVCLPGQIEHAVEGVELEEVSMPTDGRARAAVVVAFPVVSPDHAFGQPRHAGGKPGEIRRQ